MAVADVKPLPFARFHFKICQGEGKVSGTMPVLHFLVCRVNAKLPEVNRLTWGDIPAENKVRQATVGRSRLGVGSVMPGPHGTAVLHDSVQGVQHPGAFFSNILWNQQTQMLSPLHRKWQPDYCPLHRSSMRLNLTFSAH